MKLIDIKDVDCVNYKKISMFLIFPYCSFKCGRDYCQNYQLQHQPKWDTSVETIIEKYQENHIVSALVCGGLEPFDSWEDLLELIQKFREVSNDDIVIYTGYRKDEIDNELRWLAQYKNIIVKVGRYVPGEESHYDPILGIYLANKEQYTMELNHYEDYC